MQESTDLLALSRQIIPFDSMDGCAYAWVSDSHLLLLLPKPKRGLFWTKAPFTGLSQFFHNYHAFLHDVSAGISRPLEGFNRRYSRQLLATPTHMRYLDENGVEAAAREINYTPPECRLSPDGRLLLWHKMLRSWTAASLDDTESFHWKSSGNVPSSGAWMPDSRRWVEKVNVYQEDEYKVERLIIHQIDDPGQSRSIVVTDLSDGLTLGITAGEALMLYYPMPPFSWAYEEMEANQEPFGAHFSVVGLTTEQPTAKSLFIPLPDGVIVHDVQLSPDGSRLAWITSLLVEHLCSGDMYTLWISDLDGGNRHTVGTVGALVVEAENSPGGFHYMWPQEVQWLPGSHQLSFEFNGYLRTAPLP